jgi:hypothetical protein
MTSKSTAERCELENVGLRELDVGNAEHERLARGVAEAGAAQVDREQPRALQAPGHFDRMPAGTATGDQDIDLALPAERDRQRLDRQGDASPRRPSIWSICMSATRSTWTRWRRFRSRICSTSSIRAT